MEGLLVKDIELSREIRVRYDSTLNDKVHTRFILVGILTRMHKHNRYERRLYVSMYVCMYVCVAVYNVSRH